MNWTDFFAEFADKLRPYAQDRAALLEKIRLACSSIELDLSALDPKGELTDIDPFTAFALFCRDLTAEDRVKLLGGIAQTFEMASAVPGELNGVALLSSIRAVFFAPTGVRGDADIENLWHLFLAALDYADSHSEAAKSAMAAAYDTVLLQKGIRWNLTIGLSWIRPMEYLNLDQRNRRYLTAEGRLSASLEEIPSGEAYLALLNTIRENMDGWNCASFPELTVAAWTEARAARDEARKQMLAERAAARAAAAEKTAQAEKAAREAGPCCWLFSADANGANWEQFHKDGIISLGWAELGDLTLFPSQDDLRQKMQEVINPNRSFTRASNVVWQFVHDMRPGDTIYVKKGMDTILARGIVRSDFLYDAEAPFPSSRKVEWLDSGEWAYPAKHNPVKPLTNITPFQDLCDSLARLFQKEAALEEEKPAKVPASPNAYSFEDFQRDVFLRPEQLKTLGLLLHTRKNLILMGSAGTGKTWTALRLAWVMAGEKNPERIACVTFHPGCTYNDFMLDFVPEAGGRVRRRNGIFYSFCRKAERNPKSDYFFLIDEMNQGDLRKIFGEACTLLDASSRGRAVSLARTGESFAVPANLHIIGTVRTTDHKPIELSLLRQFAVYEMPPAFDSEGFTAYQESKANRKFDRLILTVERMNDEIESDEALGREYRLGHSAFCTSGEITDRWLANTVNYELIPQLNAIWSVRPSRARYWEQALRRAIR